MATGKKSKPENTIARDRAARRSELLDPGGNVLAFLQGDDPDLRGSPLATSAAFAKSEDCRRLRAAHADLLAKL